MTTVSVRGTMADLTTADLPAWVRVGCLAWSLADADGHARFGTGQLRRALDLTATQASQALDVARSRGWIDQASTARCVVLPGYGSAPCEELHR